ncbi:two-component system sensor histidine kinase/response regulator, hybrid ('one-component system') [Pedobacter sp. BAL39]|uniref:response regulator n=1 Tax=Pedobacter sp. BAL39 TaxID=391596 RepID=UPI000155960F|nr:response regulator [Pedobacter sp. BAL39]EDM37154.1 two-component system sensor histidine kinase/response regulator, hybrid ('one-component system') [Pedobacter sp. BAL39]
MEMPYTYKGAPAGKKILVIEDNEDLRDMLTDVLITYDFQVCTLEYTDDLEQLALELQPDLVLMDYMLPGINGGDLCGQLKRGEKTSHIPVVLLSAYDKVIVSLGTYSSDAFVSKPFEMTNLIATVQSCLKAVENRVPELESVQH